MRVLIIGGSGRTGRLVISEALHRGITVTALVRDPASLEQAFGQAEGLTRVEGSPLSKEDIENAITATPDDSVSAIIVTLNAPRTSDSPFAAPVAPPRLMADAHAHLINAMKQFQIPKIVTMSAFGVGDSGPNMNIVMRLLIRRLSNMSYQFEDHDLVDTDVKASGVNYVLVRPCMLTSGPPLPIKEWGQTGAGLCPTDKISRESVARFLVDAAVQKERNRQTVVITN